MSAVASYVVEKVALEAADGLAIRATVPMDQLPSFFQAAFTELVAAIEEQAGNEAIAGPPFARYRSVEPAAVDVEAIFPLTRALAPSGRAYPLLLPAGEAVQVLHVGPYDTLMLGYQEIEEWLRNTDHAAAEPPREVYLTDPQSDPNPANWRTLIVQPYR